MPELRKGCKNLTVWLTATLILISNRKLPSWLFSPIIPVIVLHTSFGERVWVNGSKSHFERARAADFDLANEKHNPRIAALTNECAIMAVDLS